MSILRTYTLLFLFVAMILSLSFTYGCDTDQDQPVDEVVTIPAGNGTLVCIDQSMSMRGYFRTTDSPGTVLQKFLWQHFIQIIENEGVGPVFLSTFGDEIKPPAEATSFDDYSLFKKKSDLDERYSGKQTLLVEVLQINFDAYKIFVILTDGIPSSPNRQGADARLPQVINHLKLSGFHLWMIGLNSDFDGIVYPECRDDHGRLTSFPYKGKRPVFFWIGSREFATGKRLCEKVVDNLLKISDSLEDDVKMAELTQLDTPDCNMTIPAMEAADAPAMVTDLGNGRYKIFLSQRRTGIIDIPMEIVCNNDVLFKKWHILSEILPSNIRGVTLHQDEESGGWALRFDQTRSRPSGFFPGCSSKMPPFHISLSMSPEFEKWWEKWSTDNDSLKENASKTLYLDSLVGNLVNAHLRESYEGRKISVIMN